MQEQSKKIFMWHKVKELSEKGLNNSQISSKLGIYRGTVRKYLNMSEQEFYNWISDLRKIPLKLSPYFQFVKNRLEEFPGFSAAQIEDQLKEYFSDLPEIHSKTVYNFVERIRKKYNIDKPKGEVREFEQLPESAYGKQAQVDFGESWMQTAEEKRRKVYFFSIVLSRSRQKYFYCQQKPFTAQTAVYAHQLAFEFFEGIPDEIIYDQDSVFISDENLGDYRLTSDFERFYKTHNYKIIFCRKADPQSKGKVENVVKYIKQNFLRGRKFTDIDSLNQSALDWLYRTGNGKRHASTQLIPHQEWLIEKHYLKPFKIIVQKPESEMVKYKVRKDNTVLYSGNFYSLPHGTYKGRDTEILLLKRKNEIWFYSLKKELLAKHEIYHGKGKLRKNNDHSRDKSITLDKLHNEVVLILGNTNYACDFLERIKSEKPRYHRDNLLYIKQKFINYSDEITQKALMFCIENKLLNAARLCEIAKGFFNENKMKSQQEEHKKDLIQKTGEDHSKIIDIDIKQSDIDTYQKIIELCNN